MNELVFNFSAVTLIEDIKYGAKQRKNQKPSRGFKYFNWVWYSPLENVHFVLLLRVLCQSQNLNERVKIFTNLFKQFFVGQTNQNRIFLHQPNFHHFLNNFFFRHRLALFL